MRWGIDTDPPVGLHATSKLVKNKYLTRQVHHKGQLHHQGQDVIQDKPI